MSQCISGPSSIPVGIVVTLCVPRELLWLSTGFVLAESVQVHLESIQSMQLTLLDSLFPREQPLMLRVILLELSAPPMYFYLPKYRQMEQFLYGSLWVTYTCE